MPNILPDYLFSISDNMVPNPEDINSAPQEKATSTACVSKPPDKEPQPGCSRDSFGPEPKGTPSKLLNVISPIPKLKEGKSRKGTKKGAVLLTSKENRDQLKKRLAEKAKRELKNVNSKSKSQAGKRKLNFESNDSDPDDPDYDNDRPKKIKKSLDTCKECNESYQKTTKKCDWLRCLTCKCWVHEDCTIFDTYCVDCGRENKKKAS